MTRCKRSLLQNLRPSCQVDSLLCHPWASVLEEWEIHGTDLSMAYLLGKLDEETFLIQPEGFVRTRMKNPICRLLRFLYGLKQAAIWNQKLNSFPVKISFVRSTVDSCLWIAGKRNIYIMIWSTICSLPVRMDEILWTWRPSWPGNWRWRIPGKCSTFLGWGLWGAPMAGFLSTKVATSINYLNDLRCQIRSRCSGN